MARTAKATSVPYGARLRIKDGDKVKRVSVWRNGTPTPTRSSPKWAAVRFEDLVDGLSVREETDEATGIAQRVVSDWRASPRGADLRPAMGVIDKDGAY
jgi:DNA-directed RNA polymerase subunit beta'